MTRGAALPETRTCVEQPGIVLRSGRRSGPDGLTFIMREAATSTSPTRFLVTALSISYSSWAGFRTWRYFWKEPSFARFLSRLSSFSRLILFDKRGTGLSDRVTALPTLEQRMDDVRAVMEAVGSEQAALLGVSEGGPMCSLFAASYPERTRGASHDWHVRKAGVGSRLPMGAYGRAARAVLSRDSRSLGWAGRTSKIARRARLPIRFSRSGGRPIYAWEQAPAPPSRSLR